MHRVTLYPIQRSIAGVLLCALLFSGGLTPTTTSAQEVKVKRTPLQISLVPGFGTHPGGTADADFSFNLIAGKVYRLRRFEIGTLLNWETEEMTGFQVCGAVNLVEGEAAGIQLAGLANVVRGDASSVSVAGAGTYIGGDAVGIGMAFLGHYAEKDMVGIYLSGLGTYNGGDNTGIAVSGLANASGRDMVGIYVGGVNFCGRDGLGIFAAGLANYTVREGVGIHVAGLVNYSGDFTGIELSLFNYAEDVTGTQIGLVNYSRSLDGKPVGLFSYVANVPVRYDLWASETAAFNAAVHSGNGKYYNLLIFSGSPYGQPFHGMIGWGFGREYLLGDRGFWSGDLVLQQVLFEGYNFRHANLLTKARLLGGYRFSDRFTLFGGLTLNLFTSSIENADRFSLWGPVAPTWQRGDRDYYFWPGLVIGTRF